MYFLRSNRLRSLNNHYQGANRFERAPFLRTRTRAKETERTAKKAENTKEHDGFPLIPQFILSPWPK